MILITGIKENKVAWHLTEKLIELNKDVRLLINSTKGIKKFSKKPDFFYGNILDRESLKGISKDIDVVFHFYEDKESLLEEDILTNNIKALRNILYYCRKVTKFIFFSTTKVYGQNQSKKHIFREDDPCKPDTFFGKAKLLCEAYVLAKKSMNPVIIRTPYIYGSGFDDVFFELVKYVEIGNIRIIENEDNRIELLNYKDLLDFLLLILNIKITGVYNITSNEIITQKEIYEKIAQNLNVSFSKKYVSSLFSMLAYKIKKITGTENDYGLSPEVVSLLSTDCAYSSELIKNKFGFVAKIKFDDGIKEIIEDFYEKKVK